MNESRHALINKMREIADALESGACQAAAIVYCENETVLYMWQGSGVPHIGALLIGLRAVPALIEKKLEERRTSE